MKFYFTSRHTPWVLLSVILLSALLLLVNRPISLYDSSRGLIVFTPATPLQIVLVGALTLGLSGRSEQFEFAGIRPLRRLRLVNATALTLAGAVTAAAVSLVTVATGVDPGTVGVFGPLRAFLGLFGCALAVIAFTDMRLGAVCSLPLVLLPAGIDLHAASLGWLGFVFAAETTAGSWVASAAFLGIGLTLYTLCYSERNSPSSNRRALIDSRGRRRRALI